MVSDGKENASRDVFGGLRAGVRGLAIGVWTVAWFCLRILVVPVSVVSPVLERRLRDAVFRTWGKGTLRIAGFRVASEGTPPKPPFVLVSNHLSYTDIVVYASLVGGAFVAMMEVSRWPAVGFLARGLNTVFVDRQDRRDVLRVNAQIGTMFDRGHGLTLFPESKTSIGRDVRPFKPALLEPAAQRQWPVHYATVRYEVGPGDPPAGTTVCWVDDTPFNTHVWRVLRLSRVEAKVIFGETPVASDDRKSLALQLHAAVAKQLVPME